VDPDTAGPDDDVGGQENLIPVEASQPVHRGQTSKPATDNNDMRTAPVPRGRNQPYRLGFPSRPDVLLHASTMSPSRELGIGLSIVLAVQVTGGWGMGARLCVPGRR
jgi:hypothetical protein